MIDGELIVTISGLLFDLASLVRPYLVGAVPSSGRQLF